jgi:hypothetical protein
VLEVSTHTRLAGCRQTGIDTAENVDEGIELEIPLTVRAPNRWKPTRMLPMGYRWEKRSLDCISLIKKLRQETVLAFAVGKSFGTAPPNMFWNDLEDSPEAVRKLVFVDCC